MPVKPNLNPKLVASLSEAYGSQPSPEEIFHYVYAVLYAPTYQEKYAEFLRMDFPRIPFTSDGELFLKLAKLGEQLMGLHLLKSDELDPPACRFEGEGDERVDKGKKEGLRYHPNKQWAHINATQCRIPHYLIRKNLIILITKHKGIRCRHHWASLKS